MNTPYEVLFANGGRQCVYKGINKVGYVCDKGNPVGLEVLL